MGKAGVAEDSAEDLDLLQGTLDVLILKTLSWGPRHGYAIARWVHDVSDDVLRAARHYLASSGRRLSFEYAMIGGVNDAPAQADALARKLRGFSPAAHVITEDDLKKLPASLIGGAARRVPGPRRRTLDA